MSRLSCDLSHRHKITFACLFLMLCINSSNFSDVEAFWEEIVTARVQRR